ncbi:hypothetical protein L4J22_15685 [Morganella morganii]|uniref:hypothetical protein n=1 Tax=Morganella morganii TaxID=582 RepID=UPI002247D24D|nr:hypothetical protein [Morganella morganii]MCW9737266.1 hypothetical protein [Morganella morganii]HCK3360337.1 hypothetical protein [Morganella morganii]HCR4430500.1 hypothetical protein [Morganella morganii]
MKIDFEKVKAKIKFSYCDETKKVTGYVVYSHVAPNGSQRISCSEHWDENHKPEKEEWYPSRESIERRIAENIYCALKDDGYTHLNLQ